MAFHAGAVNQFTPSPQTAFSAIRFSAAGAGLRGPAPDLGGGPFGTGFDPTLSDAFGSPVPAPPAVDIPEVNAGAFTRKADADVQAILQSMGFNAEAIAANFSSRGLARAGAREDAIFRQVVAPGLAQAVSARAQGELGFQNLKIQSALQQAGISTQQWAIMIQAITAESTSNQGGGFGQFLGTAIGAGAGFLLAGPPGAAAGASAGSQAF